MATGKEIKARIKSVKNTGKITKAMELISTVKMKKAQELAIGARPFAMEAARVIASMGDLSEMPASAKTNRVLVLAIASHKGLCGGYNVNLFKEVARLVRENPEVSYEFVTAGKRMKEFVLRTGATLVADLSDRLQDTVSTKDAKEISRFLQKAYAGGGYDRVSIVYGHYVSAITQKPVTKPLLPLTKAEVSEFFASIGISAVEESPVEHEYEPSKAAIAEAVLPLVYDAVVAGAMLEAKASEHAARMVAMKNAKDSANKKVKALTLAFNKARQAAITKEVSEIVSGVESMKDA